MSRSGTHRASPAKIAARGLQSGRNRVYFSPEACDLIDRFGQLSAFLAFNYENLAIKDATGQLIVNPEVKRIWDGAVEVIPQLKELLEKEFRTLLGVTPTATAS